MRTMAEMARGRGAINEATFYSIIAEKTETLRRLTNLQVFVTPIMYSEDPNTWEVQCAVRKIKPMSFRDNRWTSVEYDTVIEVIEKPDVFPSDFLIAQIMLVS